MKDISTKNRFICVTLGHKTSLKCQFFLIEVYTPLKAE